MTVATTIIIMMMNMMTMTMMMMMMNMIMNMMMMKMKPSDPAGDVPLTNPPSQKVHASFFHMKKTKHHFKLIYHVSTKIIGRHNPTN